MKKTCQVVFPIYRTPTELELIFLENGMSVLEGFDMIIACPNSLQITAEFGKLATLPVIRFDDFYFSSIPGYNHLMLSEAFYRSFAAYKHILIHQADVFVFKNELQYWCDQGYAYIGSPWLRRPDHPVKRGFNTIRKLIQPKYGIKHNQVGNGGFSLRDTALSLQVLEKATPAQIAPYREQDHHLFNEDVFWSFEAPRINPLFTKPEMNDGLRFGVEFQPAYALELLGGQLPFGCHAPLKHGAEIWSYHIPFGR